MFLIKPHNSVLLQFIPANTGMPGAYIPQYAHIQPAAIPPEVSPTLNDSYTAIIISVFTTDCYCSLYYQDVCTNFVDLA